MLQGPAAVAYLWGSFAKPRERPNWVQSKQDATQISSCKLQLLLCASAIARAR